VILRRITNTAPGPDLVELVAAGILGALVALALVATAGEARPARRRRPGRLARPGARP
jgi:hypothetical protein